MTNGVGKSSDSAKDDEHARKRALRRLRDRRYYQRQRRKRRNLPMAEKALLVRVDAGAVVRSYDDMVAVLVARRKELGWSQQELDERAGFQSGYAGKLEAWSGPQGRVAGSVTMPLWFEALGIAFVPVELIEDDKHRQAMVLDGIRRRPLPNEVAHRRRVPE